MGRLVDADELVKTLKTYKNSPAVKRYDEDDIASICLGISFAIYAVKHTPTIDPVKHGKWLHNSDRPDRLICSVCDVGFDMWYYETKDLLYCPCCGAKMDGESE